MGTIDHSTQDLVLDAIGHRLSIAQDDAFIWDDVAEDSSEWRAAMANHVNFFIMKDAVDAPERTVMWMGGTMRLSWFCSDAVGTLFPYSSPWAFEIPAFKLTHEGLERGDWKAVLAHFLNTTEGDWPLLRQHAEKLEAC